MKYAYVFIKGGECVVLHGFRVGLATPAPLKKADRTEQANDLTELVEVPTTVGTSLGPALGNLEMGDLILQVAMTCHISSASVRR